MTLTQGHISKVKVTVYTKLKSLSGPVILKSISQKVLTDKIFIRTDKSCNYFLYSLVLGLIELTKSTKMTVKFENFSISLQRAITSYC